MTHKNNAYFIVNFIFVILIGIALGYSYFFYPNNHPIGCIVKDMTGKDCSTCGFSRAFSSFTHFQFNEGKLFNKHAFGCYLFFVSQFFLRLFFVTHYYIKKTEISSKVILLEVMMTILFFLIVFVPLLL